MFFTEILRKNGAKMSVFETILMFLSLIFG